MTATTSWVRGDGTTAGGRARTRARVLTWLGVVVACLAIVGWVAAWSRAPTSSVPLAHNNPSPGGAQAAARVLAARGVQVTPAETAAQALAAAGDAGTILVVSTWNLSDSDLAALAQGPADLVLLDPEQAALRTLSGSAISSRWLGASAGGPVPASCDSPAAQAAGAIAASGTVLTSTDPAVTLCFPIEDGAVMAVAQHEGKTVTALANSMLISNQQIPADGNAALTMWLLGARPTVVWLIPRAASTAAFPETQSVWAFFPPWMRLVVAQGIFVFGLAMVWRGRRLGALVTEPLPVQVRASETTLGRARLYRRARAYAHAAAALRSGTASTIASHCGLARSAGRAQIVAGAQHATGRPAASIDAILYGPPPTSDADLATLAQALHTLESELR